MTGALVFPYRGAAPRIAPDAFVAPGASIVGDVEIASAANIWFNCVIRGDEQKVTIGARANIQDGTVIHVHSLKQGTHVGRDAVVGHMCLLHACTIEDGGFVGMGAMVLDGAVVEGGGMLAAGAMLTPGKHLPAGELWAGRPARFARRLRPEEIEGMGWTVENYARRAEEYRRAGIGAAPSGG